jgi:hypothetical protein
MISTKIEHFFKKDEINIYTFFPFNRSRPDEIKFNLFFWGVSLFSEFSFFIYHPTNQPPLVHPTPSGLFFFNFLGSRGGTKE